jgi:orotate phosphoribosyltransferase-like protein
MKENPDYIEHAKNMWKEWFSITQIVEEILVSINTEKWVILNSLFQVDSDEIYVEHAKNMGNEWHPIDLIIEQILTFKNLEVSNNTIQ